MQGFFLTLVLFISIFLSAQENRFRIYFSDKNNSPYSIENPSAFLTERSIQRRIRQNIPVQISDLPPNPNYVHKITATGATIQHQSRWFNAVSITLNDLSKLQEISSLPFVRKVEKIKTIRKPLPEEYTHTFNGNFNAKSSLQLSNDVYNYGNSYAQIAQLGGTCLHNLGYDGKNMVICVLDAGFQNADTLSCFDSLHFKNQILGTWDFVDNESAVYEDNSHGAMVLSCMGANWPSQLVGAAPQAMYWLLRTENANSELIIEEDNWAAGAEFADSVGADIINSSLGYTTFDSVNQNHTYSDLDGNTAIATIAADIAASKGILVCNSAGNEGASSWKYISVPADADSILAVAAVDANGVRAGFSSVGPTPDNRIKPDVAANGNGTYVIAPWSGTVTQSGGTSFASPLTAGMAACLWQANPGKTNMEIISAIKAAGNQASAPDTLLGWGIPNYCIANGILNGTGIITTKFQDDLLHVFYDPTSESIGIYFYSADEHEIEFSLSDLSGKILLTEKRETGNNTIHFYRLTNVASIASGIYFVSARGNDRIQSRKIMKH
jgi:serine protease AprX